METSNSGSKSRKRLIPLFQRLLNEGSVPQLCWVNKEEGIWKMPWKYHRQTVWGDPDAFMLQELAKILYEYTGHGEPERVRLKDWKEKIRNALTSAKKDVKEIEKMHMKEGDNPYKVYQFLNIQPHCVAKGYCRNETNFRGRNGETCQASQHNATSACGIYSGRTSGANAGLQICKNSHNSTLPQVSGASFVTSYNGNQHFQAASSAFQQYSNMSAVPTHLLSNQEPASLHMSAVPTHPLSNQEPASLHMSAVPTHLLSNQEPASLHMSAVPTHLLSNQEPASLHMSAVPTHPLSNQEPASLHIPNKTLPSTSDARDNSVTSSDTFTDNFLHQLEFDFYIQDECIPQDVNNLYRSRSPLSNNDEAGNMGNIPLMTEREADNDGNQEPASLHIPNQTLPSTSDARDNSVTSSDTFPDNFLHQLELLCFQDECIPQDVNDPYRSRSPLRNNDKAGNMGNIPLIIENSTEADNDGPNFHEHCMSFYRKYAP